MSAQAGIRDMSKGSISPASRQRPSVTLQGCARSARKPARALVSASSSSPNTTMLGELPCFSI